MFVAILISVLTCLVKERSHVIDIVVDHKPCALAVVVLLDFLETQLFALFAHLQAILCGKYRKTTKHSTIF